MSVYLPGVAVETSDAFQDRRSINVPASQVPPRRCRLSRERTDAFNNGAFAGGGSGRKAIHSSRYATRQDQKLVSLLNRGMMRRSLALGCKSLRSTQCQHNEESKNVSQ
jgi:hypothetical protein